MKINNIINEKDYYESNLNKVKKPFEIYFDEISKEFKESYKKYLENKLREAFGFFGTPIRISFRERKEKK